LESGGWGEEAEGPGRAVCAYHNRRSLLGSPEVPDRGGRRGKRIGPGGHPGGRGLEEVDGGGFEGSSLVPSIVPRKGIRAAATADQWDGHQRDHRWRCHLRQHRQLPRSELHFKCVFVLEWVHRLQLPNQPHPEPESRSESLPQRPRLNFAIAQCKDR